MFSLVNGHSDWINSAMFSPDTRLIASGSNDAKVLTWDITTKQIVSKYEQSVDQDDLHKSAVNSVRFHPDGTCIAGGSTNNSIKIWDIRS